MRLKDVVRAEKVITDAGTWNSGHKMPKTAFPLGKAKSFKVAAGWRWRLLKFECLECRFRLLVTWRPDLQKCTTYLGREGASDLTLLARYEWAAADRGWHLHACKGCDDSGQVPGTTRLPERLPFCDGHHRRADFGVTDDESAFKAAAEAFRIFPPSDAFELRMQ